MVPRSLFTRTRDSEIILSSLAILGKPYDGHTVETVLTQLRNTIETKPEVLIAYRGHRREKYLGKTQLLMPSKPKPSDSEYKKLKQRKRFRKRATPKSTISYLKLDFRLGRYFLKSQIGGQINVTHSSTYYNLIKWI